MNDKILNLTPHAVSIVDGEGNVTARYPSVGVARAQQTSSVVGEVNGIEVAKSTFGPTEDLPSPQEGTYLIVSLATANAAAAEGRSTADLLLTLDPVRDSEGKIVGCRRFGCL